MKGKKVSLICSQRKFEIIKVAQEIRKRGREAWRFLSVSLFLLLLLYSLLSLFSLFVSPRGSLIHTISRSA